MTNTCTIILCVIIKIHYQQTRTYCLQAPSMWYKMFSLSAEVSECNPSSVSFLNSFDLTSSYLLPHTQCSLHTVHCVRIYVWVCVYALNCMNAWVYLCFAVLSEIDRVETVFILFNFSLISLVRNFNLCNKSASGCRRQRNSYTRDIEECVCVLVNSLVCAVHICVCGCLFVCF